MHDPNPSPGAIPTADGYWQRLLHRWFVQHNPLYLLSAMLVLGGMILSSRGLAHEESLYGQLGVAAIAELYAVSLIAGTALSMRIGQRRPAVMLAILAAVYQCDLTLHTEAAVHLGRVGYSAGVAWLMLFVVKLYALAWAARLRLSIAAVATATLAAVGVALFPHLFQCLPRLGGGALVAIWLFALVALQRFSAVRSTGVLEPWGQTVLRRAVRTAWLLWSIFLGLHVLFWSATFRIDTSVIALSLPVIATRWIRSELRVHVVVAGALVVAGVAVPRGFSTLALVVALTLGLRAVRGAYQRSAMTATSQRRAPATVTPYRTLGGSGAPPPVSSDDAVDDAAAVRRFAIGAFFAAYLAAWTFGWTGGRWPAHLVWLDLALTAVAVVGLWKARAWIVTMPLAASYLHFAWQARIVGAPATALGWGSAFVTLGFVLLFGSLVASYLLRRTGVKRYSSASGPIPS